MDLSLQAKMLRFLQDKQVRRLGEDSPRPTDVRVVCATNRDPQTEVAAGRFREDLFYRLHVVPVELPPLRDRDVDVLMIARAFLAAFAKEDGRAFRGFTPETEAALMAYHWPGNVRQLQNVVRSVVVLNDGEFVTPDLLPREILASAGLNLPMARLPIAPPPPPAYVTQVVEPPTPPAPAMFTHAEPPAFVQPPSFILQQEAPSRPANVMRALRPLEDTIRETIEQAIEQCGGSIPKAAAALDVSPSTLYRRIQGWESADAASQ